MTCGSLARNSTPSHKFIFDGSGIFLYTYMYRYKQVSEVAMQINNVIIWQPPPLVVYLYV